MSNELPSGWVKTRLGVVAAVQLGKMLSAKSKTGRGSRPYLRNVNIRWHRIDVDDVLHMDFDAREIEKYRLARGDVLVCEGGEPGRAAVWSEQLPGALYQKALHRVRFDGGCVEPRLFVHYLEWAAADGAISQRLTGSTIKHLPREAFLEIPVRIPPLAEQRRIVAAFEEHLSELDAAVAGLERARANAVRMLTALIVNELESIRGDEVPLESVLESLRNGISVKPEGESGTRILRISAVRPLRVNLSDVRFLPPSGDEYEAYRLVEGDLLFTRYNGNPEFVGVCGVVPPLSSETVYPDKLIRARVDPMKVNSRFLQVALSAGASRAAIQRCVKTTAGQAGISGGDLKRVSVNIPSLEVQAAVVARVERAMTAVESARVDIDTQLARASRLRQSILKRAFEGKLVPQDPNDEPASVLLERIRAERATPATPTPRSRRKPTTKARR